LITGGGYGWLSGEYGLAIDNMLEATVVTADGQILTASDSSHPDLFWGIRGGGSNFGVVTEFVQCLHPQRATVFAGPVIFVRDQIPAAAQAIETWTKNQSAKEGMQAMLIKFSKHGPQPLLVVNLFYNGSEAEGREKFKALLDLKPVAEHCKEIPYETVNGLSNHEMNHGYPTWMGAAIRGRPTETLTLKNCDHIVSYTENDIVVGLEFFPHHKINAIDPKATPYRRDLPGNVMIIVRWKDEETEDGGPKIWNDGAPPSVKRIAKDIKELVQAGGGGYANYDSEAGIFIVDNKSPDRTRELFGPNYPRLQQIKAKYDPKCVFNKWFVVQPAAA